MSRVQRTRGVVLLLLLSCIMLGIFLLLSSCSVGGTSKVAPSSRDEATQFRSATPEKGEMPKTPELRGESEQDRSVTSEKVDELPETPELRGVWILNWDIETPEKVDKTLERVEAGGFNTVFVIVNHFGWAYYQSALLEKVPRVAPDFDPLAYVIEQAHQRNIQVHAWFLAGRVRARINRPIPILSQHPEWSMVGPDGETNDFLNYTRPDVRQFISDVMLEVVKNYDVDGIHFDYTRYPFDGWKWGFDSYSAETFNSEYGLDLEILRGVSLPAYGTFSGDPLAGVNTAQVLATFDDGRPALLLNNYGAGEVILFNWDASERGIAANSEIFRRSLDYLAGENGPVYILRSETNARKYGYKWFDRGLTWIKDIGRAPIEVAETELTTLDVDGVLVMPNVYLINAQVASDLADFVRQGGGVIFIDGPTPSMNDRNLQLVTGMRTRAGYFHKPDLLIPTGEHELVPINTQGIELTLVDYQELNAQWNAFRAQGLSKLVQEVYQRTKQEAPDMLVTITIPGSHEVSTERYFQDWQTWLDGEYTDLIIPLAYIDPKESLEPIIAEWQSAMENSNRVTLGLKVFTVKDDKVVPKTPAQILAEIDLVLASGSKGVVLFDMEHIGDDVLEALANGPFSSPSANSQKRN